MMTFFVLIAVVLAAILIDCLIAIAEAEIDGRQARALEEFGRGARTDLPGDPPLSPYPGSRRQKLKIMIERDRPSGAVGEPVKGAGPVGRSRSLPAADL